MPQGASLQRHLLEAVFTNEYRMNGHPMDPDRFPPPRANLPRRARSLLKDYLWRRLFERSFHRLATRSLAQISKYADLLPRLGAVYEKLADEHSREIFVAVLSYRILGPQRYALPHNNAAYWQQRESLDSLLASSRQLPIPFLDWRLLDYDLTSLGFPIRILGRPTGIQHLFQLEQYRYRHSVDVRAEPGDYVIDAGGCWGEVALYFAHLVGPAGRVFTFEFIPANRSVLDENLSLNQQLKPRVEVVDRPVWRESGVRMYFTDNGPGSVVSTKPMPEAAGAVDSVSLDDFVKERGLPRVDFIKMDIEGAELDALVGAEGLIRKFRPKLAISVYHAPEHLVAVPEFLDSLDLGYRFYLDHFTTHMEETVLFATTR